MVLPSPATRWTAAQSVSGSAPHPPGSAPGAARAPPVRRAPWIMPHFCRVPSICAAAQSVSSVAPSVDLLPFASRRLGWAHISCSPRSLLGSGGRFCGGLTSLLQDVFVQPHSVLKSILSLWLQRLLPASHQRRAAGVAQHPGFAFAATCDRSMHAGGGPATGAGVHGAGEGVQLPRPGAVEQDGVC